MTDTKYGYVLAWLLYKPVAAVIYATGFLVVKDPIVVKDATPATNSLMALLIGTVHERRLVRRWRPQRLSRH